MEQTLTKPDRQTTYRIEDHFDFSLPNRSRTFTGLCITCRHASNCQYSANLKKGAAYCEEFELDLLPAPTLEAPAYADPFVSYQGLCSDCEQRTDCIHAKSAGGVWHCEQYE